MKDFTVLTIREDKENKPKKTLKRFIPLYLLAIAARIWGFLYWDFHKSYNDTNIRDKKNYYFQTTEFTGIFSRRTLTAGKFDKEGWVSFYQRSLLRKSYYCTDDTGKDPNIPDGLADEVEIEGKSFTRKNDYDANKEIFHKADQNIALVKSTLENKFSEKIN